MEDMNILAFFLSYPSLPIDASDEVSDEAIKRGDEFRTYIWGEKGIDVLLKSLSYVDYGKDLKRILFQFYLKSATCNLFDICGCGYLSKTTRFRKESLYCSRKRQNPLTP